MHHLGDLSPCVVLAPVSLFTSKLIIIKLITQIASLEPQIVVQSPKEIVVNDLLKAVPLVCISNIHAFCSYNWKCVTERSRKYLSVPVLYVKHPGIYYCIVEYGDEKIESEYINVSLQPGVFIFIVTYNSSLLNTYLQV